MRDPLEDIGEDAAREMLREFLDGLFQVERVRPASEPGAGPGQVSGKSKVRNPWGGIGEEAAREFIRENLQLWTDGKNCDPEDLLQLAWFGAPPWMVRLEGKTLQGLVKLAPFEQWEGEEFAKAVMSIPLSVHWELFRLRHEGRWDRAVEMVCNPEKYGPVGDVLDLGWTREEELNEWIEASDHSWGAFEGVKRLLKRLRDSGEPIPDALAQWSMDVAAGGRVRPSIGHRPASAAYRDRAIVDTVGALVTHPWDRVEGTKKLTLETACELVAEELTLQPETVLKIWRKGNFFWSPCFAPIAIRPF